MKQNTISITINKPISQVFNFTVDPKNTSNWIDSIKEEVVDISNIGVGVKYKNTNNGKDWTEYMCSEFKKNSIFELKQINSFYTVKYLYEEVENNKTLLTYIEWMSDNSDLKDVFSYKNLEKLKIVMESQ
jgi:uncharacterized protein YndB with AHSA1/START domain